MKLWISEREISLKLTAPYVAFISLIDTYIRTWKTCSIKHHEPTGGYPRAKGKKVFILSFSCVLFIFLQAKCLNRSLFHVTLINGKFSNVEFRKRKKNHFKGHYICTSFLNFVSLRCIRFIPFHCISISFCTLVQPIHLVICENILMTCEKHLRDASFHYEG